jgi:hypothetical protein
MQQDKVQTKMENDRIARRKELLRKDYAQNWIQVVTQKENE